MISLAFSGIIYKVTLSIGVPELKRILPDIFLTLILIVVILGFKIKVKSTISNILLLLLLIVMVIISVSFMEKQHSLEQVYFVLRDNISGILLIFIFANIKTSKLFMHHLVKKCFVFFYIAVLSGFTLALTQSILGSEWASKFYTGYSFYLQDPISNIKIWHENGRLRTPSITGNNVLFAQMNFFAIVFLIRFKKHKLDILLIFIAVLSIVLSTNKTLLLMVLIVLFIHLVWGIKDRAIKFIGYLIISIIALIVLLNMNLKSLFIRITEVWVEIFSYVDIKMFLVGNNPYKTGVAGNIVGEEVFSFVDNAFIYMLVSYGVLAFIILLVYCVYNAIFYFKRDKFLFLLFISIIGTGLTTNIFQGRYFFYMTAIFIYIFINDIKLKEKEKTK